MRNSDWSSDVCSSDLITRLSGAGDGDINRPFLETVKTRQTWLIVNLGTALLASGVVSLFQDTISRLVALAVLMPIVASMGRSEERRVGKGCVSTCRSRWSPDH